MTSQSLFGIDLWGRHEARLITLFTSALRLLRFRAHVAMDENQLNRELYFCLRSANRNLPDIDRFEHLPIAEARNQPDTEDTHAVTREHKRPDFQWEFVDHQEPDPRRSSRVFVVECKRLGSPVPSNPGWHFNSNYVQKGIRRFVEPEHGYGLSVRSGLMVGYVQSMRGAGVLVEVNASCLASSLASMSLIGLGWRNGDVSRLEQRLNRAFRPTPFALHHIWLDLHPRRHGKKIKGPQRTPASPSVP